MKAQAALEYLMTYGWALLALVLAIGFLFASGAFDFSNFVSQECKISQDVACTNFQVYDEEGNTIALINITNNYPYNLSLSSGYMIIGDDRYQLSFNNKNLASGESTIAKATLPSYKTIKTKIELKYYLTPYEDPTQKGPYTALGYLVARVSK